MKKLLLLLFVLLSSFSLYAQKKVASYTLYEKENSVEAFINKNDELIVYIEITGEYKSDKVFIRVAGEKNILEFISAWETVKEKFKEWSDVAKKNNVTNYNKDYPISFPRCQIWWSGTKWRSTYTGNYIKPKFMVLTDGSSATVCGGTAKDYDNEYISQKWYQIFKSPDEIQTLINALNIDSIKGALQADSDADALFQ